MRRLETLNLDGMKRVWGRKVSDLGFGEFVAILKEVARKTGTRMVQADRWEPTSKTCACCGHVQQIPLAMWVFDCSACDWSCDRDQNDALNILQCELEAVGASVPSRIGPSAVGLGEVRRPLPVVLSTWPQASLLGERICQQTDIVGNKRVKKGINLKRYTF